MSTEQATRQLAALSYERISRFRLDASTGALAAAAKSRGVDRQAEDADEYAAEHHIDAVRHITDNNESASVFAAKPRTGWPVLLEEARSGRYTHVLVWLLDRAVRQVADISDLLAACRHGGAVIVQTGTGSVIDPADPNSVAMAQIAAVMAENEAAKMSLRQRRRKADDFKKGLPHGGRRRFGYEPNMAAINEVEAAAIRDAVRRVLAGESMYAIAKEWNARGLTGTLGAAWTGSNVRNMLVKPYLMGVRTTGSGDQYRETPGTWEPILTAEDHRRLVALVSNPKRRTNPGSNARKYLLAGLAVCDKCGRKVRGGHAGKYRCPTGDYERLREPIDAVVEGAVVRLLSRSTAETLFADDDTAEELARLSAAKDAKLAELAEAKRLRREGKMHVSAFAEFDMEIREEVAKLDDEMSRLDLAGHGDDEVAALAGPGAADAWADLSLARKRAVIARLFDVRLVSRGRGRGHKFDPADVQLTRRF